MTAGAPASAIPMPAQSTALPPTFEKLLAELIKRAASPDDPIRFEFHNGDVAHMKRWLDRGGANQTWKKIYKGPFNSGDAFTFVLLVLEIRRTAEQADLFNKEMPALEARREQAARKARKRGRRRLTKNEIPPQQFANLNNRIEKILRSPKIHDPLLSNRSDKDGTRRRTIFCRALSDILKDACGKPCDAEVAALCEIAFDCGDVTIEMVRSARRESTRKSRPRRR